ncbi:hypothetical protein Pelo_14027 [Pelomyxa schiedti]|nr:hypothetical protein Pelo_14027 [Pelomyxa schiedti]
MPSRSELPLAKAAFDASRKFDATKLDDSPIFMCLITLGFYGFSFKSSDFSTIAGGLMFSAVIFASELLNALFFHFTHYSPLWISNPLKTQMQLTVGLNMESVFLTLLLGFVFSLFIPSKKMIFFCLPARLMWAFMGAIFAAALQLFLLNPMGIITFKYSWWGGADFLSMSNVMLFGYLSAFVLACWMHGIPYPVIKVALPVSLLLFELGVFIFLGPICHWI